MTKKALLAFTIIYFSSIISGVLSLTFVTSVSVDILNVIIHSIPIVSIMSLVILLFYVVAINLLHKPNLSQWNMPEIAIILGLNFFVLLTLWRFLWWSMVILFG
jgi:hypothetical protein